MMETMVPHLSIVILVFGFVFAIVLQAWFVRRTAALAATVQDRRDAATELAKEVSGLAEELQSFQSAIDANTIGVSGLEREIEELQQKIEDFPSEKGD